VAILEFLFGLSIGLGLFWWQRSRLELRLKKVLRNFQSDVLDSSFNSTSQLALVTAQQQQLQQQLEQQLATYELVLQQSPIGYLQVDDENRLIWCNHQARSLLGIHQDTDTTRPRLLLELVRSYELDDLIEKTRDAGQPCQIDWIYHPVSSDPSELSEQHSCALRGHGLPLMNKQVGVFLESRQETVTLLQRYDRWASDLAHELKTPLTSIRLIAETIQARLDSPLKTWVDRLINETIRLSVLVQDLLDLSRLQRDAFHSLHLQSIDLVQLIDAVWASLEPLARAKSLTLDYRGPDHLLMQLDEARIHRLLVNLLDNSIKFSPDHQKIEIKVSVISAPGGAIYLQENQLQENQPSQQRQVCLEVIDFGPGFSDKDLPYVFDRFYRADLSRTRPTLGFGNLAAVPNLVTPQSPEYRQTRSDLPPQGGSGLGLAIVRQIVEAHQGSICANNHPETGGAWLQVYLPYPETASPND
jgi:two-component system phosphate regulon sensor histidine kinase PhoR